MKKSVSNGKFLPQDNSKETIAPPKKAYFNFLSSINRAITAKKKRLHQYKLEQKRRADLPNTLANLLQFL